MRTKLDTLGHCPSCSTEILATRLLIRYETQEGWPRMYADCPECHDVVRPE